MIQRKALLAAGGTGGHLFPASALAGALKAHGYQPILATDKRGMAYLSEMEEMPVYQVPAATVYAGGARGLPWRVLTLVHALIVSTYLIIRFRPDIIIGFGGYPSFGPVMAGLLLRVPVLVHEQNAVLGRANRLAAVRGASLATSFSQTNNVPQGVTARMRKTGSPLRPAVLEAAQSDYRYPAKSQPFDLLVFGGSQGTHIFAQIVPKAIAQLSDDQKSRLRIVHQARKADIKDVLHSYGKMGVYYVEIRDYFVDLPYRMRCAQLVICRGGASTVSELTALGVPSIIVPLPGALDQDQANNARELLGVGGTWLIEQDQFSVEELVSRLAALMPDEKTLRRAAACALSLAEPDATNRLCRYAMCLAECRPVQIEEVWARAGRG